MSNNIECDIAIIGAGSGGLSLAAGASQLGAKVVLCEKGKMGGDCLNTGCVPSKSLLAAAKRHWQIKNSQHLGTTVNQCELDFQRVMQHVKDVIAAIEPHDSVERFEGLGVHVIQEHASFIDGSTLKAGDSLIKAKRIVVATGSSAAIPPIKNVENVDYLTNENIFDITELPKHLLIVGGGPIGCEMAQAFAMLGSKVTVLEGFTLLNRDEPDCVDIVRQALHEVGVEIHEKSLIKEVTTKDDGSISIVAEQNHQQFELSGTHLLIAAGRRANTDGLALDNANVDYNKFGIVVDERLRSSNKSVYAIGDVAGRGQFTHLANYHAGIVLRNLLFKMPAKISNGVVPAVTYTEPELASVGKTLKQCEEQSIEHVVNEFHYAENDRALAEAEKEGKVKVISDKKGKILGVTIVGHNAGELLMPWVMAIREKKTLRSFTDTIVAYPTLSEVSKRAASAFYTEKLFSPKVKKIVKFLLKF